MALSACMGGQLRPGEMKSLTVKSLTAYPVRAQASCPQKRCAHWLGGGAAVQALWSERGRLFWLPWTFS